MSVCFDDEKSKAAGGCVWEQERAGYRLVKAFKDRER